MTSQHVWHLRFTHWVKTLTILVFEGNVLVILDILSSCRCHDPNWICTFDLTGKVSQSTHASGPQQQGQVEEAVAPVDSVEQTRPADDPHPSLPLRSHGRDVEAHAGNAPVRAGARSHHRGKPRRNVAGGLWKYQLRNKLREEWQTSWWRRSGPVRLLHTCANYKRASNDSWGDVSVGVGVFEGGGGAEGRRSHRVTHWHFLPREARVYSVDHGKTLSWWPSSSFDFTSQLPYPLMNQNSD